MKRTILAVAALACAVALSAQTDFEAMLRRADSLVSYTDRDFSAEYTITQIKPNEGSSTTVAAMFRRDRNDEYLIILLKPDAEKGKGYLKLGEMLWLYDPASKRFTYTSAKDRFQSSTAKNADFTKSTMAQDYDVVASSKVKLDKYDCWCLELKAATDKASSSKMKVWISDDGLVRMSEEYSASGQLVRTVIIPSYQKLSDRYIPAKIVILDNLRFITVGGKKEYERTEITVAKPSFSALPANMFTKEYLEKVKK